MAEQPEISSQKSIEQAGDTERRQKKEATQKSLEILSYTGPELQGEKRIEEPMSPECKVAVCIPAYGEGSDILDTLELLAAQEGIAKDQYEVIVDVNNPKDAQETVRSSNQDTLKLLQLISADELPGVLEPELRVRLEKIRGSGMVVHAIDQSSPGSEVKAEKTPDWNGISGAGVMRPRKRMMDEAAERFAMIGQHDGVIVSLDADTKVGPGFLSGIMAHFGSESSAELLAVARRDGEDLREDGTRLSDEEVFDHLLEGWNSDERRADPKLGRYPDVVTAEQKQNILAARALMHEYNELREKASGGARQSRNAKEKAFKGGTGKAFKVGAYITHPKDIIQLMDADGRTPQGVDPDTMVVDESDALAVYPESRVRDWAVDDDIHELKDPFGSSGKEATYEIVAGLTGKEPQGPNPARARLGEVIGALFSTETQEASRGILRDTYSLSDETIDQIIATGGDADELIKLTIVPGSEMAKLNQELPERVRISEAIEQYKSQG